MSKIGNKHVCLGEDKLSSLSGFFLSHRLKNTRLLLSFHYTMTLLVLQCSNVSFVVKVRGKQRKRKEESASNEEHSGQKNLNGKKSFSSPTTLPPDVCFVYQVRKPLLLFSQTHWRRWIWVFVGKEVDFSLPELLRCLISDRPNQTVLIYYDRWENNVSTVSQWAVNSVCSECCFIPLLCLSIDTYLISCRLQAPTSYISKQTLPASLCVCIYCSDLLTLAGHDNNL